MKKIFAPLLKLILQITLQGKIFVPRTIIQKLSYYIIPTLTLIALIVSAGFLQSHEIAKNFGNVAMNIFLVILFASPLRQIFPQFKILTTINGFRRELGILCMWFSLWHSIGYPLSEGKYGLVHWWHHMEWTHFYFWGTLGLIGMLILGITSNTWACLTFKTYWKKIHYLIYPTFGFVLLHLILIGELGYIFIGAIYCVLRYFVWKKKKFRFKMIEQINKNFKSL